MDSNYLPDFNIELDLNDLGFNYGLANPFILQDAAEQIMNRDKDDSQITINRVYPESGEEFNDLNSSEGERGGSEKSGSETGGGDIKHKKYKGSDKSDKSSDKSGSDNERPHKEDELVLYKGRKILRSERLRQMRESQRKLRKARVNEVSTLKLENDRLRSEMEMLKNDTSMFLSVLTREMPNYSIGRLLQHVPPMRISSTFVDYPTFINAYKKQPIDKLYTNGKFFLQSYTSTIFKAIMTRWKASIAQNVDPYCKSFIYMPIYGYSLFAKYFREVEYSMKNNTIPSDWLKNDDRLPPDSLSITGLIQTLLDFKDLDKLSFEILISILIRYNFATPAGPTILRADLEKAIERATSVDGDVGFLSHNSSCLPT